MRVDVNSDALVVSTAAVDGRLEAALSSHPDILDCAVIRRVSPSDAEYQVAFVVAESNVAVDALLEHAKRSLREDVDCAFVRIGTLPRLANGDVDRGRLSTLAFLDTKQVRDIERRLSAATGAEIAVDLHTDVVLSPLIDTASLVSRSRVQPSIAKPIEQGVALAMTRKAAVAEGPACGTNDNLRSVGGILIAAVNRATARLVHISDGDHETASTYTDLHAHARHLLSTLQQEGLAAGDQLMLQLRDTEPFITALWACFLGGITVVPLAVPRSYDADEVSERRLARCVELLDGPVVLTSLAEMSRRSTNTQTDGRRRVLVYETLCAASPGSPAYAECSEQDVALLQFSSGTTSDPKCIALTHGNLLSVIRATADLELFQGNVSVSWMPLDHVGSLVWHLRATYLGQSQVMALPDRFVSAPLDWLDWLDRFRGTTTRAPNFAFSLVNRELARESNRRWDLSTVRAFVNAAEPIDAETCREFLTRLQPHGLRRDAIVPCYGLAETSSGVVYGTHGCAPPDDGVHVAGRSSIAVGATVQRVEPGAPDAVSLVEVGTPVAGTTIRIVDDEKAVVPEDTIGHVQIKGSTVAANHLSAYGHLSPALDESHWLTTGDLGFIKNGALTLTGRQKDVVIVRGANIYADEIEQAVRRVHGVDPTCVAVDQAFDTDDAGVTLFVAPLPDHAGRWERLLGDVRACVTEKFAFLPETIVELDRAEFPKTSVGKIQKGELRRRLRHGEFAGRVHRHGRKAPASTIRNWFFIPEWIATPEPRAVDVASRLCLVFAGGRLSSPLIAAMSHAGMTCVIVMAGDTFRANGPSEYVIDPRSEEHYVKVLTGIASDYGQLPDDVVHAWGYGRSTSGRDDSRADDVLQRSTYSVVYCAKALQASSERRVHLTAISSNAAIVSGDDAPRAECFKSTLEGVLLAVESELRHVECHHVELDVRDDSDAESRLHAAEVMAEIRATRRLPQVAYRGGRRLVRTLNKASLRPRPSPLKRGGLYVVSGGFGGIGQHVCRHLLYEHDAKVIVLGRRPVSAEEQAAATSMAAADRLEYHIVDLSNASAVLQIVRDAESRHHATLDGIVHLAGVWRQCPIADETADGFKSALEGKVYGALALSEVAREKSCALVMFSSLAAILGGHGCAAYASANAFLHCLSLRDRYLYGAKSTALAWTFWRNTGMQQDALQAAFAEQRGSRGVSPAEGLDSLLVALSLDQTPIAIGLDESNPRVRRRLSDPPVGVQRATAQYRPPDPLEMARTIEAAIARALEPERTVDIKCVAPASHANGHESVDAPDAGLQAQILSIFRGAFASDQISLDDDFFRLGGDSLIGASVIAQLRESLQRDIASDFLFHHRTPRAATRALATRAPAASQAAGFVPLRTEGADTPLFLFPPAMPYPWCYKPLLEHGPWERPIYGAYSTEVGWERDMMTFEHLALHYLVDLRRIQKRGPYVLAGWSFGGLLAFEIACRLMKDGQDVERLVLFDTFAPSSIAKRCRLHVVLAALSVLRALTQMGTVGRRLVDRIGWRQPLQRAFLQIRVDQPMGEPELRRILEDAFPLYCSGHDLSRLSFDALCEVIVEQFQAIFPAETWKTITSVAPSGSSVELVKAYKVMRKNIWLAQMYRPRQRFDGRMVIFAADDNQELARWQRFTSKRVEIRRFPIAGVGGEPTHLSFFAAANVKIFADDLRAVLNRQ